MAEPGEILLRRDDDGRIWCETWPLPETILVSLGLLTSGLDPGFTFTVSAKGGDCHATFEFDSANVSAVYRAGPVIESPSYSDVLLRLVGASQKGQGNGE